MGCNCKDKANIAKKSVREGRTPRLTAKGKEAEIALQEKAKAEHEAILKNIKDKKQFNEYKKQAIMSNKTYQMGLEALNRLKTPD